MVGDRPCTGCGYNLIGQPIVRDAVYNLLLVRCPECAVVASLLEYPLLGRWAARWARLLAAAWLLALVLILVVTAATLSGLASWVGAELAMGLVSAAHGACTSWWMEEEARAVAASAAGATAAPLDIRAMYGPEVKTRVSEWWDLQGGVAGFVAAQGGWRSLLSWWAAAPVFIIASLFSVSLGAAWAVATLGVPRRRLWAVWLLPAVATLVGLALITMVDIANDRSFDAFVNWYAEIGRFASWRVQYPATLAAAALLLGALGAGLLIGRGLVRLLVVVLLPPRLRWGLAFLWTAEGLKPPKST
jgi:MFS family permease